MRITDTRCLTSWIATGLLLLSAPVWSQGQETANTFIQGGHSGAWYDVTQPGHGLFVEVLDSGTSPTGKEVIAAWFAFLNGRQVWLLGQGDVVKEGDAYVAILSVAIFEGNDFPPDYDVNQTGSSDWGTIRLAFDGCDQARLAWDSTDVAFGFGTLILRRLTTISDSSCDPTLGGEVKGDDHGDNWVTGTYLTNINPTPQKIDGRIENKDDVDVFVFTLEFSRFVEVYTLGTTTDTFGSLYRLSSNVETLITTDNDSSDLGGFYIAEQLQSGTYTIHVKGENTRDTGPYDLYVEAD